MMTLNTDLEGKTSQDLLRQIEEPTDSKQQIVEAFIDRIDELAELELLEVEDYNSRTGWLKLQNKSLLMKIRGCRVDIYVCNNFFFSTTLDQFPPLSFLVEDFWRKFARSQLGQGDFELKDILSPSIKAAADHELKKQIEEKNAMGSLYHRLLFIPFMGFMAFLASSLAAKATLLALLRLIF